MALSVVNNVASLNPQNNLNRTIGSLSKSLERLSSGLKINRGADGPAALVISEQQRAQITGLQTALDNTNKSVSLVQTAEGALNEINRLLGKVRGLALDSANSGVNDSQVRAANQSEIDNALTTITNIANTTQFGTKKLLDGSAGLSGSANNSGITFLKAGSSTAGVYKINITTAAQKGTVTATEAQTAGLEQQETLTLNGVLITLEKGLLQTEVVAEINKFTKQTGVIAEIDKASNATRLVTDQYGSQVQVSVQSSVAAGSNSSGFGLKPLQAAGVDVAGTIGGDNATGKGDRLTGTSDKTAGLIVQVGADNASNTVTASQLTATTNADTSVPKTDENIPIRTVSGDQGAVTVTGNPLTFQISAQTGQTATISIDNVTSAALGVGLSGNQFKNLSTISVLTPSDAQDSVAVIDQAISDVSNLRSKLGAFQANTLESNANNLRATLENTVAAESTIRDTDFATEVANFTRNQVLLQAGSTVLGNANQTPQLIADLLRG